MPDEDEIAASRTPAPEMSAIPPGRPLAASLVRAMSQRAAHPFLR